MNIESDYRTAIKALQVIEQARLTVIQKAMAQIFVVVRQYLNDAEFKIDKPLTQWTDDDIVAFASASQPTTANFKSLPDYTPLKPSRTTRRSKSLWRNQRPPTSELKRAAIKTAYAAGGISMRKLAAQFGVSLGMVQIALREDEASA